MSEGDHWVLRGSEEGPPEIAGLVPAVDKALRALALINESGTEMSLAAIADKTRITKSHCHTILKTLAFHGWLAFSESSKTYRLHVGILRDLSSILRERARLQHIKPILQRMTDATRTSCILSQPLPDDSFLVVERVSAPREIEISYPVGHRSPRDAAAQMRANLAWRTEAEIERWFKDWEPYRYTAYTLATVAEQRAEIAATRRRGYSRSVGEFTEGVMAMALPVFDERGEVLFIFDCIGVVPSMRDKETQIAAAMIRAAEEIHRLLGSVTPPDYPRPQSGAA